MIKHEQIKILIVKEIKKKITSQICLISKKLIKIFLIAKNK